MAEVEKEYITLYKGSAVNAPFLDSKYRALLIGRINQMNGLDLENLSGRDWHGLQMTVLSFLAE